MSLQEPLLRVTGQDRKQTISSGAGATALPPIAFPPIIVWPGWGRILFVVILGTFISLCLTVWAEAVHDLTGLTTDQLLEFGSIPFVSTIFTYFHIWLALWMTFYPIHYTGCCQIPGTNTGLGWQGIVPNKGIKMATKAVRLMTEKLLKVEDIFKRLDPNRVYEAMAPAMRPLLAKVISDVGQEVMPDFWSVLPASVKTELVDKACDDAPRCIHEMFEDMHRDVHSVFNLEHMVVEALAQDLEMLHNVFIRCGNQELSFIRNSGAYAGFIFGSLQMVGWFFYRKPWTLPAVGMCVGVLTNWVALKIIFEPVRPVKLGCCELQGLFLKRQKEVSAEYGRTIAAQVLTSDRIMAAMLAGPTSAHLYDLLSRHLQEACDSFAGLSGPLLRYSAGDRFQRSKGVVCHKILQALPSLLLRIAPYVDDSLDMAHTLQDKLAKLPPEEFEGLLHPVFEEDEWKLVVVGGVLGALIGVTQMYALPS